MNSKNISRSVAMLVAGIILSACSGDKSTQQGGLGSVGLAIKLADNTEVDLVRYSITGGGLPPVEGNIAVGDPGATVSALIEVQAAVGYTIELAAASTNAGTVCLGEASFDVVAGQTTSLSITMECQTEDRAGSVEVNATLNTCPRIASLIVAPLAVAVGGQIDVSALGADPNAADTLTYSWTTSGGGTFATPGQASTRFTCTTAGRHTLTATVSDAKCVRTRTVAVTCTP